MDLWFDCVTKHVERVVGCCLGKKTKSVKLWKSFYSYIQVLIMSAYLRISTESDAEFDLDCISPVDERNEEDDELAVNLIVGGAYFSLPVGIMRRYPASYFAAATKRPWKLDDGEPIVINRDGTLFTYVLQALSGWKRTFGLKSVEWVLSLRQEADFYNIGSLVKHCNRVITRKILDSCWDTLPSLDMLQPEVCSASEQTNQVFSQLLPSCIVSNVDVSGLSGVFYDSLERDDPYFSGGVDVSYITTEEASQNKYSSSYSSLPDLVLSDKDEAQLVALVRMISTVPGVLMYAEDARVCTAAPSCPAGEHFTFGTMYCILKVCLNLTKTLSYSYSWLTSKYVRSTYRLVKTGVASVSHITASPPVSRRQGSA